MVDLVRAAARFMRRPVEIQLMNWARAQQLVMDGKADALIQINPNPERREVLDFSSPLLDSDFAIFTSSDRLGIASLADLRGKKVGVEQQGMPMSLLAPEPQITAVPLLSLEEGLRLLGTGSVDAVIADRRVGTYLLAEDRMRGIRVVDRPVDASQSAIAVKKGNTTLLEDIDRGLTEIRRNGTYDRILRSWTPKEVVYLTRQQERRQWGVLAVVTLLFLVALAGIAALVREVRRRRSAEAGLEDAVPEAPYVARRDQDPARIA